MVKVDLHTHSILSYDGGITEKDYLKVFSKQIVHVCAITDHDEIAFAQKMQSKYPDNIIVGQEVSTSQGHLIGLYLKEKIAPLQNINDTIAQIKSQGGLVYLPHPLERQRNGVSQSVLQSIAPSLDILEIYNARSLTTNFHEELQTIAQTYNLSVSSSSDAHGFTGVGTAYNILKNPPKKSNLTQQLINPELSKNPASFLSRFSPTLNKIKKRYTT